jgi:hypothetical protein
MAGTLEAELDSPNSCEEADRGEYVILAGTFQRRSSSATI